MLFSLRFRKVVFWPALREVNPKSGGYPQVFARLKNWILSAAEIDRLRSGCLPDACREVADGHRVLNL